MTLLHLRVSCHLPRRGVALVQRLPVDGDGPSYRAWASDDLYAAAEEARHAL